MFATAIHSLWSAAQYKAPYLTIVYQNRSYSTGTLRVSRSYPKALLPRPDIRAATSSRRSTLLPKLPNQPVLTEKTLPIPKK